MVCRCIDVPVHPLSIFKNINALPPQSMLPVNGLVNPNDSTVIIVSVGGLMNLAGVASTVSTPGMLN